MGGIAGRFKAVKELRKTPSMAGLGNLAAAQGVKHYNTVIKGGVALVTGAGDPIGAVKDALGDGTDLDAVAGQIDGKAGSADEEPYHVPKSTVEEAFG